MFKSGYRQGAIIVIALLLCGNLLGSDRRYWPYYNNSKAWAKAAAAIVFGAGAHALKTYSDKLDKEKKEPETPYTINLMWLNRDLKEDEPYIIRSTDKLTVETYLSSPCFWASKNSQSTVQFWYDSKFTSQDSLDRTKRKIEYRLRSCPTAAPIVFKDIRELAHVKDNPEAFSSKVPVYFRADLTRVIAGYEEVKNTKNIFVYADLDVEAMSKEDLFDTMTKKQLKEYGMVMGATAEGAFYFDFITGNKQKFWTGFSPKLQIEGSSERYENSFYILSSSQEMMLKFLKSTIIDLNVQRASHSLNAWYRYFIKTSLEPQTVYFSYPATYAYFYHMKKLGTLKVRGNVPYDEKICPISVFGIDSINTNVTFESPGAYSRGIYERETLLFPVKKVKVPRASGKYYDDVN